MEDCIIYGALCMNIDVVRPSVNLPSLSKGDRLVIHPVGAYNVTQWMQFIHMRPRVVLIGPEGTVELIRERESLEDILYREQLPDRLKLDPQHFQDS